MGTSRHNVYSLWNSQMLETVGLLPPTQLPVIVIQPKIAKVETVPKYSEKIMRKNKGTD